MSTNSRKRKHHDEFASDAYLTPSSSTENNGYSSSMLMPDSKFANFREFRDFNSYLCSFCDWPVFVTLGTLRHHYANHHRVFSLQYSDFVVQKKDAVLVATIPKHLNDSIITRSASTSSRSITPTNFFVRKKKLVKNALGMVVDQQKYILLNCKRIVKKSPLSFYEAQRLAEFCFENKSSLFISVDHKLLCTSNLRNLDSELFKLKNATNNGNNNIKRKKQKKSLLFTSSTKNSPPEKITVRRIYLSNDNENSITKHQAIRSPNYITFSQNKNVNMYNIDSQDCEFLIELNIQLLLLIIFNSNHFIPSSNMLNTLKISFKDDFFQQKTKVANELSNLFNLTTNSPNKNSYVNNLIFVEKHHLKTCFQHFEHHCSFETRDMLGNVIPKQAKITNSTENYCHICGDEDSAGGNLIVYCDICNMGFHQDCYGIPHLPDDEWICQRCSTAPSLQTECVLCPNTFGALKRTQNMHEWCHMVCAFWTGDVIFANPVFLEPIDISNISPDRFNLTCYICRKQTGACIQCMHMNCCQAMHATCAQMAGCLVLEVRKKLDCDNNVVEIGSNFKMYCKLHFHKNVQRQYSGASDEKGEFRSYTFKTDDCWEVRVAIHRENKEVLNKIRNEEKVEDAREKVHCSVVSDSLLGEIVNSVHYDRFPDRLSIFKKNEEDCNVGRFVDMVTEMSGKKYAHLLCGVGGNESNYFDKRVITLIMYEYWLVKRFLNNGSPLLTKICRETGGQTSSSTSLREVEGGGGGEFCKSVKSIYGGLSNNGVDTNNLEERHQSHKTMNVVMRCMRNSECMNVFVMDFMKMYMYGENNNEKLKEFMKKNFGMIPKKALKKLENHCEKRTDLLRWFYNMLQVCEEKLLDEAKNSAVASKVCHEMVMRQRSTYINVFNRLFNGQLPLEKHENFVTYSEDIKGVIANAQPEKFEEVKKIEQTEQIEAEQVVEVIPEKIEVIPETVAEYNIMALLNDHKENKVIKSVLKHQKVVKWLKDVVFVEMKKKSNVVWTKWATFKPFPGIVVNKNSINDEHLLRTAKVSKKQMQQIEANAGANKFGVLFLDKKRTHCYVREDSVTPLGESWEEDLKNLMLTLKTMRSKCNYIMIVEAFCEGLRVLRGE